MRLKNQSLIPLLITSLIFSSLFCGGSKTDAGTGPATELVIPEKFRGVWYESKGGSVWKWEFTTKDIVVNFLINSTAHIDLDTVNDNTITTKSGFLQEYWLLYPVTFEFINNNTIKGTFFDDSTKEKDYRYLFRSDSGKNAAVTGKLVAPNTARGSMHKIGLGGLADIQVVLTNLNDVNQQISSTTDADGNFTINGANIGSVYSMTADGASDQLIPVNSKTEAGGYFYGDSGRSIRTLIMTNPNEKTELQKESPYIFAEANNFSLNRVIFYVLREKTYSSTPVKYTLTPDAGITFKDTINSGTDIATLDTTSIEFLQTFLKAPDNFNYYYIQKDLDVDTSIINDDYSDKTIYVSIEDSTGAKWEDKIVLRIYRKSTHITTQNFNILSPGNSAYVITPDGQFILLGSGILPYYSEGFTLIFPAGIQNGAYNDGTYAFGIDHPLNFNIADKTVAHDIFEPNGTLDTATSIFRNNYYISYFSGNDLDIFKIAGVTPPDNASGINATDGNSGSVTVGWNPVNDASKYFVYRIANTSGSDSGTTLFKYGSLPENEVLLTPDGTSSLSFEDTTGVASTKYYYFVRTNSANGYSTFYNISGDSGYRIN